MTDHPSAVTTFGSRGKPCIDPLLPVQRPVGNRSSGGVADAIRCFRESEGSSRLYPPASALEIDTTVWAGAWMGTSSPKGQVSKGRVGDRYSVVNDGVFRVFRLTKPRRAAHVIQNGRRHPGRLTNGWCPHPESGARCWQKAVANPPPCGNRSVDSVESDNTSFDLRRDLAGGGNGVNDLRCHELARRGVDQPRRTGEHVVAVAPAA